MEIWKDIIGYEGLYQVSNCGRVKSLYYRRSKKEKILIPNKDKDGYFYLGLSKNNKRKWVRVHRLVAEAFINNTENLPQVNHKDEDVQNNNVENLEWCSAKYNTEYSQAKSVTGINIITGEVIKFKSAKEAGKNGFHQGHLSACCRGEYEQHKGYTWSYDER